MLDKTIKSAVRSGIMTEEAGQPDSTPLLHRPISNRGMEILLVGLILALIVLIGLPMCAHRGGHPAWLQDLSNIRQAMVCLTAYAVDHDGRYPAHFKLAEEYVSNDQMLRSPYDHQESLVFDDTVRAGWYPYGSYWFLSAEGLAMEHAEQADKVILAYRTPRLDHDFYIVGFADGHAEVMSSEDFKQLKDQQDTLIRPPGEGATESGPEALRQGGD